MVKIPTKLSFQPHDPQLAKPIRAKTPVDEDEGSTLITWADTWDKIESSPQAGTVNQLQRGVHKGQRNLLTPIYLRYTNNNEANDSNTYLVSRIAGISHHMATFHWTFGISVAFLLRSKLFNAAFRFQFLFHLTFVSGLMRATRASSSQNQGRCHDRQK